MDKLKELLKQWLGDKYTDEVEQQVDETLEEHVSSQVETETTKLRKNNQRLTQQLKEARAGQGNGDTTELEEKIDTLEQEKAQLKKQHEKLQKSYEKDTKELATAKEKVEQQLEKNVVDQEMARVAVDNGVFEDSFEPIRLYVQNKGPKVEHSDDGSVAVKVGETPLGDFVKEMKETPWVKRLLADNAGGRTQGEPRRNGGASGAGEDGEEFFNRESGKFNVTEQGKIAREDPERFKRLKEKYSR